MLKSKATTLYKTFEHDKKYIHIYKGSFYFYIYDGDNIYSSTTWKSCKHKFINKIKN